MTNTLTDDTDKMAQNIISAALTACKAIDILKEIQPAEVLTPGPKQELWKATLDQLGKASSTLEARASWLRAEYRLQRARPEEETLFQQELAEMLAQEREGEEDG